MRLAADSSERTGANTVERKFGDEEVLRLSVGCCGCRLGVAVVCYPFTVMERGVCLQRRLDG